MVSALEISLDFTKHLVDKVIFLHADKKLFSSSLQILADQLITGIPSPSPSKKQKFQ
jgi:hypothetical protein